MFMCYISVVLFTLDIRIRVCIFRHIRIRVCIFRHKDTCMYI